MSIDIINNNTIRNSPSLPTEDTLELNVSEVRLRLDSQVGTSLKSLDYGLGLNRNLEIAKRCQIWQLEGQRHVGQVRICSLMLHLTTVSCHLNQLRVKKGCMSQRLQHVSSLGTDKNQWSEL